MPSETKRRRGTGRGASPAAPSQSLPCGHSAHSLVHLEGRNTVAVDASTKKRTLGRLRRIEGQVRGLQRMVDEERYCAEVLVQITSVHEALRAVAREMMRNHLKHCASAAIRGRPDEAEAMYDELVELFHTHSR